MAEERHPQPTNTPRITSTEPLARTEHLLNSGRVHLDLKYRQILTNSGRRKKEKKNSVGLVLQGGRGKGRRAPLCCDAPSPARRSVGKEAELPMLRGESDSHLADRTNRNWHRGSL